LRVGRIVGGTFATLALLGLLGAIAGGLGRGGDTSTAAVCPACTSGHHLLYWGAWLPDPEPWRIWKVRAFERLVGKRESVVSFGLPFAYCPSSHCSLYKFPGPTMREIRGHGAIPFISWSSQAVPAAAGSPSFSLAAIASGRYDSMISTFARAAKRWGHPFFLRFDWEMNGKWFPWGTGTHGNTAALYVTAWRHVHDIFTSVGATNASWVWCPNADAHHRLADLPPLYPGDAYVDWTCLDGYNHGTFGPDNGGWMSFARIFGKTYREITRKIAPSKPMILGEVASTTYGGSKPKWIARMFSVLPTKFPQIRGLIWFERPQDGWRWPLTSSPAAEHAFARGVQSSAYVANQLCRLNEPLIPVLASLPNVACNARL
jgi:hypothetical protein